MRVFRVSRREHAGDPLGGRGGLYAAGRWHPKGRRIVYASATLSLSVLEVLVHVDKDLVPPDLVFLELDVPDELDVEHLDRKALPEDWREYPGPTALQILGVEWLDGGRSAILEVPSALIPRESNYLINPAHTDTPRIRVVAIEDFVLDARLFP
jgi:RES domain-containing protein